MLVISRFFSKTLTSLSFDPAASYVALISPGTIGLWRIGVSSLSFDTKNVVTSISSVSLREALILKVRVMGSCTLRRNDFSMGSFGATRSQWLTL